MKAILAYGIDKTIDKASLQAYLQLNYIPGAHTIFDAVKKIMPGHYAQVERKKIVVQQYYAIPYNAKNESEDVLSYDSAMQKLSSLLEESVKKRLIADVPLGAFLSGGVDSSVITALASKHKPNLHTFSIGYQDEPFFDETSYARLVAKKYNTEHTVFSLTNDDLYAHLHSILDYIDEPFADSSAIGVYILSQETRKHATVALSGDGADELLGGYNKHAAFHRVINKGWKEHTVGALSPIWKRLPQSRNGAVSNAIRQLRRFAEGMELNSKDRYWRWAGFATESEISALLRAEYRDRSDDYTLRKESILARIPSVETINDILLTDMNLVLADDMLVKVDRMSMANSLEVRVPFLDFEVVNFIFQLPGEFKINKNIRKRLLQDTFRDILPRELYNRPKKGFEVPLLGWLRKEMRSQIENDLLSEERITEQGIFEYSEIRKLKRQLFSSNPGDVHARIWGLIVFQWWWKKYMAH
jgi:asparagine synthase (glutamine-hydrolysing)